MVNNFVHTNYLVKSFLFFGIFPLLPVKLLGLPVILFFIVSIISFILDRNKKLDYRKFLIAISPYFLFFISALYSEDIGLGIKKITEARLSLFVVPLSFFLLSKKSINIVKLQVFNFKLIYVASSFLMSIIYLCYLPFVVESNNPSFRFPTGFFFKSAAANMPYWYLEPVYFSFIITIAFVFLSNLYNNNKIKIFYFIIISIVYFSVLFLMVSKLALIFIAIFVLWLLFYKIKNIKQRVIIISLLLITLYPIYRIPSVKYEIEEIQYFIKGKKRAKDDPNDKRSRITESSFELIKKINPVFGTGIGDVQRDLNKVYKEKKYKDLLKKKYDVHNQFISMYLGGGVIGVIVLFIYLFILIRLSINNRQVFFLWICIFFIMQMCTETVLERQLPVIIMSFITSIILFLQIDNIKIDECLSEKLIREE